MTDTIIATTATSPEPEGTMEEMMHAIDVFHETIYAANKEKTRILLVHTKWINSLVIASMCSIALNIALIVFLASKGIL